jgi:hypothetical protein
MTEFYTWDTIASFAGAVAVALLIPNVIAWLFPKFDGYQKYAGLAITLAISLLIAYRSPDTDPIKYFVGVVNGFVLYGAAYGANSQLALRVVRRMRDLDDNRRPFWLDWL